MLADQARKDYFYHVYILQKYKHFLSDFLLKSFSISKYWQLLSGTN